jgi:hypothetical protein
MLVVGFEFIVWDQTDCDFPTGRESKTIFEGICNHFPVE